MAAHNSSTQWVPRGPLMLQTVRILGIKMEQWIMFPQRSCSTVLEMLLDWSQCLKQIWGDDSLVGGEISLTYDLFSSYHVLCLVPLSGQKSGSQIILTPHNIVKCNILSSFGPGFADNT